MIFALGAPHRGQTMLPEFGRFAIKKLLAVR
jgi:hypothetical protein